MSTFGKGQFDGTGNELFEPLQEPYHAGFHTTPLPTPSDDGGATYTTAGENVAARQHAANQIKSQRKKGKRPNTTVTLGPFTTSQINTKANGDYNPVMQLLIALDWSDGTLRGLFVDVMAGITLALSQVAPSVAFSIIAHMNPINGLYASFVQGIVMAFLGGRPGQLSGPPGSMVVLYPELVDKHGPEALYAACILTGILMWLPGIFCVAKYVRILPLPVMIGFVNGLGVILALNQINSFKDESGEYVTGMRALYSVLLCLISFGVVIFLPRVTSLVPSPFVALIAGAAIEHIFGLGTVTVKDLYVLSGAFPIPKIPDLNYSNLSGDLVTDVIMVAILSFIVGSVESLMMVHLLNNLTGTHGNFEVEILAGGAANILTGFFQGFAGCGLVGPSILNFTTGGGFRRVSALIYSIGMILVVVVASPAIDLVPMPVLAAVVFYVSYKTFDWSTFEMILFRRIPLMDSLVIVLVVVITVEEDLAVAVACGFGLALLTFFYDMSFGAHCIGICRFKKSKDDSCCRKCCWCLYSTNNNHRDEDEEMEMMGRNTSKKEGGNTMVPSPSNSSLSSSDEELFERDTDEIRRTGLGRMFVSYSHLTNNPYQPLPQTLGIPHDGILTSSSDNEDGDNDLSTPASVALNTSIAFKYDNNKEMWAATKAFVRARQAKLASLNAAADGDANREGETTRENESLLTTTRVTIQSKVTASAANEKSVAEKRSYHHHAQHHRHILHHSHPRSGLLSVEIHQAEHEVPGVVVLKIHCTGLLFFGSALAFQQCCDQVLDDLTFAGYRRDVIARKRAQRAARAAKKTAAAAATTQTEAKSSSNTENKRSIERVEDYNVIRVKDARDNNTLSQEDLLGKVTDIVFDCGYGRMTLHDSSAIDTIQEIASTFARKLSAVIDVPIHNEEGAVAGVVSVRVPLRSHVHNLDRQSELLVKRSRPLFMESVMHDNLRKRLERSEATNVCFIAAHNVVPFAPSSSADKIVDTKSTCTAAREDAAETEGSAAAAISTPDPHGNASISSLTPNADGHPGYIVVGFDVYSTTLQVVVPVYATLHQWQHDSNYKALLHAGLDSEVEELASLYFGDIENPLVSTSIPSRVKPSSLVGGHHRLSLYDYSEKKALPWYKKMFAHKSYVRIPELSDLAAAANGMEVPDGVIKHVRPIPLHYKLVHSTTRVTGGLGDTLEVMEYLPNTTEKPSLATEPIFAPTAVDISESGTRVGDSTPSTTPPVDNIKEVEAYLVRNMIKVSLFSSQTTITEEEGAALDTTGSVDENGFPTQHKRLETGPIPKRTFLDWVKRVCNPTIDACDINKM